MAAPLFFLMTTGARDGTPGLQTDLIRWGLRQFAEIGLGLPQILLADKELAEQNAWSIAAHEALESATALDERLALVDVLRTGAASASPAHINAARRFVALLGAAGAAAPRAPEALLAGEGEGAATALRAAEALLAGEGEGAATALRAAEAPLAGEGEGAATAPRVAEALLAGEGEGEGAATAPRAAEAPLAWPSLADVLLEPGPAAAETPLVSDTVVALFHADIVTQFKPLLVRLRDAPGQTSSWGATPCVPSYPPNPPIPSQPAFCFILLEDLTRAEAARMAARRESASSFMKAHDSLHVWAGLLAVDYQPFTSTSSTPKPIAGNFVRRYLTPTFALCWIHAIRAMDRAGKGVPKALKDRVIKDFFSTVSAITEMG